MDLATLHPMDGAACTLTPGMEKASESFGNPADRVPGSQTGNASKEPQWMRRAPPVDPASST